MNKLYSTLLLGLMTLTSWAQFPASGEHYVTFTGQAQGRQNYLYNDLTQSDGYTLQSNEPATLTNAYIWRVQVDGNVMTNMVNGQGQKYGMKVKSGSDPVLSTLTFEEHGTGYYLKTDAAGITSSHNCLNVSNGSYKNAVGTHALTTWSTSAGPNAGDNLWTITDVADMDFYDVVFAPGTPSVAYINCQGQLAMSGGFIAVSKGTQITESDVTSGAAGYTLNSVEVSGKTISVTFEVEPINYVLASSGTPEGASVEILGKTYTGINDQGTDVITESELTLADIAVNCTGGYVYYVLLDNDHHQINVAFKQLFVPAQSTEDVTNTYSLFDASNRYVTVNGDNIFYTNGRSGSDKFIFLEDTANPGKYYIYDVTAGQYIYYTATSASKNTQTTAESAVRLTADKEEANSWGFIGENYDITGIDIFAGSIDLASITGSTQGWNYRGGNGYVLNLYNCDDRNSSWHIADSNQGSLACATLMYSVPGGPYMHKLIPEQGVTVESVDFGTMEGLTLMTDRARYKYVSGTAPEQEGTYTYTVNLSDGTRAKVTLVVDTFLQSPTPFMGWLSWNWFQRGISATNMTDIAKGLKDKGLVEAGFTTLVLDDTWANPTNNKEALEWNSTKFPNPAKFVSDVKAIGIKVGLYSDAGSMTCENYQPGSYGYETQHVAKFDSWGIDFLKYDRCNAQGEVKEAYGNMGKAIARLNATRKGKEGAVPFMFNACEWGDNQPWTWGAEAGASSWRSSHDVREDWCGNNSRPGVLYASDVTRDYWMYAGVNRYNDLDMMCIGLHGLGGPSNNTANHQSNGGKITALTTEQARSQMSIWCMFASPLSLTCDVRQKPSADGNSSAGTLPKPLITDDDLAILTNADIIAINQDSLGQQAEYMPNLSSNDAIGTTNTGGYSVYLKDLQGGNMAVAIVNRSGTSTLASKNLKLSDLYLSPTETYNVKNVWSGTEEQCTETLTTGTFKASETKVFVISRISSEGEPDGIDRTATEHSSHRPSFDLSGRRVSDSARGVQIQKGKKKLK